MNRNQNQSSNAYYRNIQRIMEERVPELRSIFTTTPIAYDRWREPTETMDNRQTGFIRMDATIHDATNTEIPVKTDYIYVAKPSDRKSMQPGYYHLRTAEAHKEAYRRFCAMPRPSRGGIDIGGRLFGKRQYGRETKSLQKNVNTMTSSEDTNTVITEMEEVKSINSQCHPSNQEEEKEKANSYPEELYFYREAKRILYNRTWTPEPDDILAQQLALVNTQSQGSVNKGFAHATYTPAVVSSVLLSLGGGR